MDGRSLHNLIVGLCMHLYLASNGPGIALVPGNIECPGTSPFTDALHFVSIHMYSLVIYYMTEAFQSLWVKVNFTLAKKEMVVS